jgi:hypothetical protein
MDQPQRFFGQLLRNAEPMYLDLLVWFMGRESPEIVTQDMHFMSRPAQADGFILHPDVGRKLPVEEHKDFHGVHYELRK